MKTRDSAAIGGVGNYMAEAYTNLQTAKNKFQNDLENIKNNYKGRDADAIVVSLENGINRMNSLLERIYYYSGYMKGVSSHDKQNIENASKQINSMLQTSPLGNTYTSSFDENGNLSQGITFTNENGGGQYGQV